MNLLEILPSLGEPRGASPVSWQCWPGAVYIDWGGELNHVASAVVDPQTGVVYSLELFTGQSELQYLDPEWRDDFLRECQAQGLEITAEEVDANTVYLILSTLNPEGLADDPT